VDDTGADPADLRMSATLRFRGNVLGQFDVGLDLPWRDELELIGTRGKIVLPDPWICREARVDLWRDGAWEHLPACLPRVQQAQFNSP
jgi:xylose dehydrogenase (NAD/NADP)